MSGSAESTPDAFTAAVNQVLQLHQDQMRSEYKNKIHYTSGSEWVLVS